MLSELSTSRPKKDGDQVRVVHFEPEQKSPRHYPRAHGREQYLITNERKEVEPTSPSRQPRKALDSQQLAQKIPRSTLQRSSSVDSSNPLLAKVNQVHKLDILLEETPEKLISGYTVEELQQLQSKVKALNREINKTLLRQSELWENQIGEIAESLFSICWSGNVERYDKLMRSITSFDCARVINMKNSRGQTPLYMACRNGHLEIVVRLLNVQEIDVNCIIMPHGGTALHGASFEGHRDCVALLLHVGANYQIKNKEGFTARQEAKGDAMDVYQTFDLGVEEFRNAYPIVNRIKFDVMAVKTMHKDKLTRKLVRQQLNPVTTAEVKVGDSIASIPCIRFTSAITLLTESELAALGNLVSVVEDRTDGTRTNERRLKDSTSDSDFVVEVPVFCTTTNMYKTEIPDYYLDCFYDERHINWMSCSPQSVLSLFSVLKHPLLLENGTRRFEGLINSATGFQLFDIDFDSHSHPKEFKSLGYLLEVKLKKLYPELQFNRLNTSETKGSVRNIEQRCKQSMTKIFISVILCRDEQSDPLKMFENPTSEAFEKFLDIMEVPKSKDDRTVWSRQDVIVTFHVATRMNSEEIRRLIGNCQAVIFFQENCTTPFRLESIKSMGIVPQFFAVVKPVTETTFRVGFFQRAALVPFGPQIPSNSIFDGKTVKEFLMTKLYNGYLAAKKVPPINRLWEIPRQKLIDEVAFKYCRPWMRRVALNLCTEMENNG